ncbi:FAD-binding dehydrogenase [Microlunatus elymi]|uniref:FAD-binding dehydrogenase n=1 Tax=Microlunatus elymi TaxID=2596828 RepID=A0A516PWS8_9ACTN|nr:FAD-binding dehydrogenase [Microlunatus elymi]QDP95610.1 FAD-binding dehydrogenase [Microlunatus elymi]
MDADVIVIGAGLSGLVATSELAAAGRSVLLLDSEPVQSLGGQAHWSFGGLFLVDTPEQRHMRVHDSAEIALADWLGSAGFDRDCDYWPRRWAEAYVNFSAGELRSWLHGLGVRWFPVVQWAERGGWMAPGHGNSVPRFHIVWGTGPGLVGPFADQVQHSDRVRILNRHKVSGLIIDDDGVRVEGTILSPSSVPRGVRSDGDGVGGFSLTAQAVIISSGGIGANLDLVRQNWPGAWGKAPENMIIGVPDFVDGSMLQVAEDAGGRVINRDRMWHYPEGILNHTPLWTGHGIRILAGPSSLWLDARGERLPAPYFPGFDSLGALRQITSRGDTYSWFVLDAETIGKEFALSGSEQNADLTGKDLKQLSTRVRPGPTPEVRAFLDRGPDFIRAGDVGELATRMNALAGNDAISAEQLRKLIEARDLQVRSGLGKDPQVTATAAARRYLGDRLIRVATPHPYLDPHRPGSGLAGPGGPLIAVRLHVLTRKTLGGLETDLEGRVLTAGGDPLPGVYAAGEVSGFGGGGMHGYRSLEGTFLGGCLHSGRIAGRAAARAVG